MLEPNHDQGRPVADTARLVPLRSVSALGELVERSQTEPVVLFQHDPYCPISRRAYREVEGAPIQTALVDVAKDEQLSRMIEERTGVRHESPQVLLLRSGEVVWSASHYKITRKAVMQAVHRNASNQVGEDREIECGSSCGRRRAATEGPPDGFNAVTWLRAQWGQL